MQRTIGRTDRWGAKDTSRLDEPVRADQPRGFGGAVEGWHDIVPSHGRILRVPQDAIQDGPFLRVPEGTFDAVFVETLSEGFGNVESFVTELASRLAPGGRLFLDAEHQQSPRALRVTLEGKPNTLDPVGSFRRPEITVSARRLLDAARGAGLAIEDLYRLPHPEQQGAEFVRAMIDLGFMASGYAGGSPAARLWLCASRRDPAPGSVLIGPGAENEQQRTRACLMQFLPAEWEVHACTESTETEGFNRGVAATTGDTVWLLRAGSMPTRELFDALWQQSVLSVAVPGGDGGASAPGDVDGWMASRRDLMRIGPIDESWSSDLLAFEEYGMRLDAAGLNAEAVGGGLVSRPLEACNLDALEAESKVLFERWEGVGTEADPLYPGPKANDRDHREPPPWHGRKPRVSLCMIARDEERFLDDCLRRAGPAVDEIIVVDTGSVDRTIEIARSHGAKVIEQPWNDDFATPRNTGLQAATGDWVLILDADEMLEDGAVKEVRRIVEDPNVCGYHIHFTNVYDDTKTLGVTMVRLIRNLPGIEWKNRIHEQITPSLLAVGREQGLILSAADVRVAHYGYTGEIMDSRGKLERNERLFKLQLEEQPDDVYSLYKYGDFLRRCPGRDREAREVLERTFEIILENQPGCPRGIPYAGEVAALCALEYAREDNYDRAEEILEIALRRFMVTPNLHYIAAGVALRRGREDEAIAHYERCLAYRGQTLVVPIQEGITGHVSLTGIAQALLQKGNRAAARRVLEQAIGIDPSYDVSALVLSRLWVEDGDIQRAVHVLTEFLRDYPDSPGACQQLTLLLAQLGHSDQARRFGERAIELFEAGASEIEANQMRQTLAALP